MASHQTVQTSMTAGRVHVRADPAVQAVQVLSIEAKLRTDARAVAAAASARVTSQQDLVSVEVPEPAGRGRSPQVMVDVVVPVGTHVRADSGEAEVVCTGTVGDLWARTSSGSVHAELVTGTLDVRSGRGPLTVHHCAGRAEVSVADAGIIIRAADGPVRIQGRSGDVDVWWLAAPGEISTTTGNVRVGWARGRPVSLTLPAHAGTVRSEVRSDPGAADSLAVATISGDVRVTVADPL